MEKDYLNGQDIGKYDDIINLEYYKTDARPHMAISDRAAQFSPFSALVGYEDAIKETARFTDFKRELSDDEKDILSKKLNLLMERIGEQPEITITYFVPDNLKSGGTYEALTGRVKKVDMYERAITFIDNARIMFDDISDISGLVFEKKAVDYEE